MTGDLARKISTIGGVMLVVCVAPCPNAYAYAGDMWARTARLPPVGSYTSDGATRRQTSDQGGGREAAVPALGVSEMVKSIRDRDMPVATIAEMARVERKSVYAWLDGGEVRSANEMRVRELHGLLALWDGSLRDLRRVWNRPSAAGPTLHDLLTSATLSISAITAALDELRPAAERRARQEAFRHVAAPGARNPILDEIAAAELG